MIFIAKNEDGESSWKLVQDGVKTVTRRMKPMDVGKEFAICPGRGKYAVCRAKVIDCMNSLEHFHRYSQQKEVYRSLNEYKADEARLEGFNSWDGLMRWFQKHKINFADTFRIEFELIKND